MFSQKTNVCREGAITAERTPGSHVLKQLKAQAKPWPLLCCLHLSLSLTCRAPVKGNLTRGRVC